MSGVDPNRLINLALALAQRHTDETDELAAAHAAYDAETASAWQTEDPEFGNALHLAFMLGDIKPLKQYLCSEKPLTRVNRQALAGHIDILVERATSLKRQRSAPQRRQGTPGRAGGAERRVACGGRTEGVAQGTRQGAGPGRKI